MIMIGIPLWMLRLLIELIVLVEPKMCMSIGWSPKAPLKRELLKEPNRSRMCNPQYILVDSRVINLNPKKYSFIFNF